MLFGNATRHYDLDFWPPAVVTLCDASIKYLTSENREKLTEDTWTNAVDGRPKARFE